MTEAQAVELLESLRTIGVVLSILAGVHISWFVASVIMWIEEMIEIRGGVKR